MPAKAFRDCPNYDWCVANDQPHLWEHMNPRTEDLYKRGRVSFLCTRRYLISTVERMRILRG